MLHTLSYNMAAAVTKVVATLLCLSVLALATVVTGPRVQALVATDASIKYVLKEAAYEVDVSVSSDHLVRVGVGNNGSITADIEIVLLLRSTIGQCEARWNAQPSDDYIEDRVDTDGDNVADTLLSEIDRTLPDMLPGEAREVARTYTVHCFQKSFHDDAISFEVGVVPAYPIAEENSSDNQHRQNIDVTTFGVADVKKLGLFPLDVTIDTLENIVVTVRSVLHNNGPYGATNPGQELVTVTDDIVVTAPGSCPVTPDQILGTPVELPVSVDIVLDQEFTLTCNALGLHTIEWDDCIEIQNVHVRDPNPDNNCASMAMVFTGDQVPGPPVVGGTVGLVDGDEAPRQASGSSSTSATPPTSAAAAGGVVALAAGGWYAKRRWMR